ncbi:hypothetical protein [Candidatus Lariskella endosymbiont of Hedychridium roseum]|uniref:hypothetical protein n=1 Tax=Candidatus Lariskella endosymbiont of Hedychridium roseum TaxID=3077949 RepID=UPI0030D47C2D
MKKLPTSFITRASGIDKTEDEIFIVGAEEGSINRISINSLTGASRSAMAEAESLVEAERNIKKPTSLVNKASKTDQIRSNNSQSTQSGTIDLNNFENTKLDEKQNDDLQAEHYVY